MILPDVNVLVYAFREDSPHHKRWRDWLERLVNSDEPYGMADQVLSGFLRVVTHARVFDPPAPLEKAWEFVEVLRARPNCVPISPGARHWDIFGRLVRESGCKGNMIADAYLAAMAIESGCEWATTDHDYARFKGLRRSELS